MNLLFKDTILHMHSLYMKRGFGVLANIKWYLDTLGLDFKDVITTVNAIPRLY